MLLSLTGCGAEKAPVYQDAQGFRITLPADWVARARGDALSPQLVHRQARQPLPPLQTAGKPEQLLVRYDRVTSGRLGWLRVTAQEVPAATPLKTYLAGKLPGPGWKRDGEIEEFELSGLPAARANWLGRFNEHGYLCETVAVRNGDKIYLLAGSVPADDSAGREQIRQAVSSATWQ